MSSAAVSLAARRVREDKLNKRAFQALIQAMAARWLWFTNRVSTLFLWLPEWTMKMTNMAKCFIAFIQALIWSPFWCKITQHLRKRKKVHSVSKKTCIKEDMRVIFLINIRFFPYSMCLDAISLEGLVPKCCYLD